MSNVSNLRQSKTLPRNRHRPRVHLKVINLNLDFNHIQFNHHQIHLDHLHNHVYHNRLPNQLQQ